MDDFVVTKMKDHQDESYHVLGSFFTSREVAEEYREKVIKYCLTDNSGFTHTTHYDKLNSDYSHDESKVFIKNESQLKDLLIKNFKEKLLLLFPTIEDFWCSRNIMKIADEWIKEFDSKYNLNFH